MDPQMMMLLFAGEKGLSGLASGFGQYESGLQQAGAYDYNADVTLQQMQQKMMQLKVQEEASKIAKNLASGHKDVSEGQAAAQPKQ